jgi:hypothetical protein
MGILNVPAELQLAMLAAVRFACQASLGQKGLKTASFKMLRIKVGNRFHGFL